LFTGDHIWWSRHRRRLNASRDYCWYSWREQIASVRLLERYAFEWILPGHGERVHFAPNQMAREMARLTSALAASR
jgi:glyoxylase-like metal-dependent hydrolase (beta-lactamase superfamily II)